MWRCGVTCGVFPQGGTGGRQCVLETIIPHNALAAVSVVVLAYPLKYMRPKRYMRYDRWFEVDVHSARLLLSQLLRRSNLGPS